MSIVVAIIGQIVNGSSFTAASQKPDFSQGGMITLYGTLTLSGNYGTASSHGDPLDFTTASAEFSFGNQAPTFVDIKELTVAGAAPLGFIYNYNPGPTLAAPTQKGGVLCIVGTGASSGQGGTELTEGSAYSSFTPSLNGAVLWFDAQFARL